MNPLNWLKNKINKNKFKGIRIEEIKPFEKAYEVETPTVWFTDSTIEECIKAVETLNIKHIHLQTKTIDFLNDKRLTHIKGITIQYSQKDIAPILKLKHLSHLTLPKGIKGNFDFSLFPELIYLAGELPIKYTNFQALQQLKYVQLFDFKKSDFSNFSGLNELRKIKIYSGKTVNLKGISHLKKLNELSLEKFHKLESLEGFPDDNSSIEKLSFHDCKRLRDLAIVGNLSNLKQIQLSQINEINSFEFLNSLHSLEDVLIHPASVKVVNSDYYPLIEKLEKLNLLENLKDWKPLQVYLDKSVQIVQKEKEKVSELSLILSNLSLHTWAEKLEDGMSVYTKKNCDKAINIFSTLIDQLEKSTEAPITKKMQLIKESVVKFNKLNEELGGGFIETGEREELCDIFDDIADAVGIDILDFEDGIASEWREW